MRFKIHRGAKEMGSSYVEIWTDTNRVVIDMGMPLLNPDKTPFDANETESRSVDELIQSGILPDIPSLYQDGSNTAVLISHPHQDHYGLMKRINPSCKVYLGFTTQLLIELTNTFPDNTWTIPNAHHLKHDKPFKTGDIKITPYLMDNAAFDSYVFLIEAGGKSLFYSGDFRLHGQKSNFDLFAGSFKESVDYLFLEGSTIGSADKPFSTESALAEEFIKIFEKTKGIHLVYVSAQNIDRLKTIHRACEKCRKFFLIDFYTATTLKTISKKVGNGIPFPSIENFPLIKVYYPKYLTDRMKELGKDAEIVYPFKAHKIEIDELDNMASKLVMLVHPAVQEDLEQYLHKYEDGCFIYSMRDDYKNQETTKGFLDFITGKGMPIKDIHTSGHADLPDIKRMAAAVKPKYIVPIHTFEGDEYAELFPGVDVLRVDDQEIVEM